MSREAPYIPLSDVDAYNYLVGGIPVGALIGIFGTPKAGKSILATQIGWTFLAMEKNALLVDTEGGAGDFGFRTWMDAFNKRFAVEAQECRIIYDADTASFEFEEKPAKGIPTFFILDCRDIETILHLHGFKVRLEVSDPTVKRDRKTQHVLEVEGGGKVNIRYDSTILPTSMPALELKRIEKTPIGKLVAENNIGYIQYDSLTNPTEIFVSGQTNFPGRDDVNGLWLQQIQSLTRKFAVTPSCIFHLSKNPTSPYDSYGHPIGGKSVGHNFKYTHLIRRLAGPAGTPFSTKAEKLNVRNVYNMFHPTKPPFQQTASIKLDENGFHDAEYTMSDD